MSDLKNLPAFKCPHCGAEIEYSGTGVTTRCQYCGSSVPVPVELRPSTPVTMPGMTIPGVAAPSIFIETVTPTTVSTRSGAGCALLIVGIVAAVIIFAVFMINNAVTSVTSSLSSIPGMPNVGEVEGTALAIKATLTTKPTKEPTRAAPTITPTPAFAKVILTFGEDGQGAGQFKNPSGIGVDGEGRIYVGESSGGRIQVFDANGKFISQFFAGNKKAYLAGMTVDRMGVVYVADGADITRYDGATGKVLGKLAYSGGPGFGELALAPDGGLYAMWYERRSGIFTSVEGAREDLVHFDSGGKVVKVLKGVISSMTDNLELDNSLAVDGRSNVYVAAHNENAIYKFDSDGKFITQLGSSGEGQSIFDGGLGLVAVDGQNRVYASDSYGIRVLKSDGSILAGIYEGSPTSLAIDDQGAIFFTWSSTVKKLQLAGH